jgi:hypothetical protein
MALTDDERRSYATRKLRDLLVVAPTREEIIRAAQKVKALEDDGEPEETKLPEDFYRLAMCYFLEDLVNDAVYDIKWFIDRHDTLWENAHDRAKRHAALAGIELPVEHAWQDGDEQPTQADELEVLLEQ